MIRLGIVGTGGIAGMHIENILAGKCPGIEIVAAADRKENRRTWVQERTFPFHWMKKSI